VTLVAERGYPVAKGAGKIVIVIIAVLLASVLSQAQQPPRVYRIGFLIGGSPDASTNELEAFRHELHKLGYVEGQNLKIDVRWHPGERPDLLPEIAEDLVRSQIDILVGANTPAILALKQATKTVPIVMVAPSDPVGSGHVQSLARPGGNVTGLA
jgi:putative ABC transport system substrate-binding protein